MVQEFWKIKISTILIIVLNNYCDSRSLTQSQQIIPQKFQNCEGQINSFLKNCKNNDLNLLRRTEDDFLSPCCFKDACCEQFEQIMQSTCLKCSDIDPEILEMLALYKTVCVGNFTTNQQLNECSNEKKIDKKFINQQCVDFGTELIEDCGFQVQNSREKLYVQDGQYATCCWPQKCCEITSQYFQNNCQNTCQNKNYLKNQQNQYQFANSLTHMWHDSCNLPQQWKECGQKEQKITPPKDGFTDLNLTMQIKIIELTQISNTSNFQNQLIQTPLEPQNISFPQFPLEFIYEYQPYQQNQQISSVNLLQRVTPECEGASILKNYGPQKPLMQTLQTFCTLPTLEYLASLTRNQVQLCCDLSENVVQEVCDHFSTCPQTKINLLNGELLSALSIWEVICTINYQNCPKQQALSLVTSVPPSVATPSPPPITLVNNLKSLDDLVAQDLLQYNNIYNAINSMPMLSIFSYLLKFLGVEEQLGGLRPITIFAPTNSAFTKLANQMGKSTTEFTADVGNPDVIRTVLSHLAQGYLSKDLLQFNLQIQIQTIDTGYLTMVLNTAESVQIIGCCSELNRANVISLATFPNGVLWVVNQTILPQAVAYSVYDS